MGKKRKKQDNEDGTGLEIDDTQESGSEESSESQVSDNVEVVADLTEEPQNVEAVQEIKENTPEAPQETVVENTPEAQETKPVVQEPVVEVASVIQDVAAPVQPVYSDEQVESPKTIAQSIAKKIMEKNSELSVSVAEVSRGALFILIKQKGNINAFCRLVRQLRTENSWEAEYLANVPPHVFAKINDTLISLNIPNSKRLYFNPGGVL